MGERDSFGDAIDWLNEATTEKGKVIEQLKQDPDNATLWAEWERWRNEEIRREEKLAAHRSFGRGRR